MVKRNGTCLTKNSLQVTGDLTWNDHQLAVSISDPFSFRSISTDTEFYACLAVFSEECSWYGENQKESVHRSFL